jgi:hypothetical protein
LEERPNFWQRANHSKTLPRPETAQIRHLRDLARLLHSISHRRIGPPDEKKKGEMK